MPSQRPSTKQLRSRTFVELCFTVGAVSGGTPTLEVAALVPVGKHPLQILRCECCGYWRKVPTALQRLSSRQPGSSCTSRRRGISLSIRARWPTVPLLANWETLQETTLARSRRIVEAMFSSERLAAPCRRIRRSTRRLFPGRRLKKPTESVAVSERRYQVGKST